MPKSVSITARRLTPEELQKRFRISSARKKELQVLVDEFKAQQSVRKSAKARPSEAEKRRKRASAA